MSGIVPKTAWSDNVSDGDTGLKTSAVVSASDAETPDVAATPGLQDPSAGSQVSTH